MVPVAAPEASRRRDRARGAFLGAAGAYGAATVAVVAGSSVPTSYSAVSAVSAVTDLAAGLGLIAAGSWWSVRRAGAVGPLAVALGAAWLAPDWVGWMDGPAVVRGFATVAAPFALPLLAHLVMAFPDGRAGDGPARRLVGVTYGLTAVFVAGRALVDDPFLDLHCWSNCTDNVFLVHPLPELAGALDAGRAAVAAGAGAFVAVVAVVRLVSATATGRRVLGPVLTAAAAAAAVWAVRSGVQLSGPPADPLAPGLQVLFQAQAASLALLAVGLGWSALQEERTRRALARLAGELATADESRRLPEVLARALADPTVEVGYWLPADQRFVDPDGRPFRPRRGDARATTLITRGGQPLACVGHDPALGRTRDLVTTIGSAAQLAVDNERLMAEVRAHLEELRASCARIVAVGDAARSRWERDLHDGAQQRLFALAYELRMARAAAEDAGDSRSARELEAALQAAGAAAGALRELAHGLCPPLLTDAGLGPALQALTDEAPVPVVLRQDHDERLPQAVERAAYLLVSDAIALAGRDGAQAVQVSVKRAGTGLRVCAAPLASAPSDAVVDRFRALGGRLQVEAGVLTAEVPCG